MNSFQTSSSFGDDQSVNWLVLWKKIKRTFTLRHQKIILQMPPKDQGVWMNSTVKWSRKFFAPDQLNLDRLNVEFILNMFIFWWQSVNESQWYFEKRNTYFKASTNYLPIITKRGRCLKWMQPLNDQQYVPSNSFTEFW